MTSTPSPLGRASKPIEDVRRAEVAQVRVPGGIHRIRHLVIVTVMRFLAREIHVDCCLAVTKRRRFPNASLLLYTEKFD